MAGVALLVGLAPARDAGERCRRDTIGESSGSDLRLAAPTCTSSGASEPGMAWDLAR
jgi:hypothetical protein